MKGTFFLFTLLFITAMTILEHLDRDEFFERAEKNRQTILQNQDTLKRYFREHIGVCGFELSEGAKEYLKEEYNLIHED